MSCTGVPGKGLYITRLMRPSMRLIVRDVATPSVKLLSWTVGTANIIEWAKLALPDIRAPVLRVTHLRHDELERPFSLEQLVLILDRFPGLQRESGLIPDIAELARRYGLPLSRATERIRMVPASGDTALHLGIT